jgi:hypothetical protein
MVTAMASKRVQVTPVDNLTFARLTKAKVYDPPYEHAYEAFHSLDKDDKIRALRGADERNFANYDVIILNNADLRLGVASGVFGASDREIRDDFRKMGIEDKVESEKRNAEAVAEAATHRPMFPNLRK